VQVAIDRLNIIKPKIDMGLQFFNHLGASDAAGYRLQL